MTKKNLTVYALSPEWLISQAGDSLLVSGGADAIYEIELETSDKPSYFAGLTSKTSFARSDLNIHDQRILEQLVTAEIVKPILRKSQKLVVGLIAKAGKFSLGDNESFYITPANNNYDLGLIVRDNGTYAELLEGLNYQTITKPHLLVDMAYHHTLSLGPLVFPGETACIACLQGRLSSRWGDDQPPAKPLVGVKYGKLIQELVSTELAGIAQGDTSLVNKTYAWNFQDRFIKKNTLLKVPICPICSQNKIDLSGALALPWVTDVSSSHSV